MLGSIRIGLLLFLYHDLYVHCLIPSLTVRKLDAKLIKQKRLDNFEMCRIFNAENRKLQLNARFNRRRVKRSLAPNLINQRPGNSVDEKLPEAPPNLPAVPSLREEDARRVENIVDKLYDDLTENGERVTYRQREFDSRKTTVASEIKKPLNVSNRRFDFAPALLMGPENANAYSKLSNTVPGPLWVKKWKHGIVPYFIDPKTYDSQLAERIMEAFDYFEKATCIRLQRLREKPIDRMSLQDVEWVYISNPAGIRQCVHSNEKIPNKGVQMVVLGYDCLSLGEIVHEVMHILGFSHEHTRADRSEYLTVFWDNIKPGYKKYFEVRAEDILLQLPYDYASVMHYPQRAFSKNGKVTLQSKDGEKLGQRVGLSNVDMEKVNMIFGVECVDRNNDYLLTTCPSVVKNTQNSKAATSDEVKEYFKNRIWPYGIVFYKLRDPVEFSAEERENIQAVINHIQKETCIEFIDFTEEKDSPEEEEENPSESKTTTRNYKGPKPTDKYKSDKEKPQLPPHNQQDPSDKKEKPLFPPDNDRGYKKEKPLFPPDYEQEKPLFPPDYKQDKPLFPPDSKQEKALFPPDSKQEKPLFPPDSKQEKALFPPDSKQEKPLFPPDYKQEKPLFPPDYKQEKALFPPDYKQEKPLFPESDKDKPSDKKDKSLSASEKYLSSEIEESLITPGKENLQTLSGENEKPQEPEAKEGADDTPKDEVKAGRKRKLQLNQLQRMAKERRRRRDRDNRTNGRRRGTRRQNVLNPKRRHAANILVLTRSDKPGCKCPKSGKPDTAQTVLEINADCFNSVNDLLHVFVHLLGLDHQHNMHDRDEFLHIVWDKLTPDLRNEMQQKLPPAAAVGFPYDYQSVMHYPWLQIKNGVTTIMYPIWNDGWAMGHWQGLSSTDVQKLNLLYFEQCLNRKDVDEGEN